ncbi:MAG TPA: BTAD domain-containing putative transcriptional regulator [Gemmatimonadaceae bacterium]|nr:BTAD domain-containing putative transcriptional regulator [Gemmatimonadaceae bacterium]
MLTLRTLGGLSVLRGAIPLSGASTQPRRLALLARVAVAGSRGLGRAAPMAQLWPDADEEHARRALNQLVYAVRRDFGDDVFTGTNALRLNPDVMTSDVGAFTEALDQGDWARAVDLYKGPFLDGFHLADAPEYDRWADEQRDALVHEYTRALSKLADAAAQRGDPAAEVEWLRRLAAADRHDSRIALRLMHALSSAGDRAGALRHAQIHEAIVRSELGVDAGPAVAALVGRLRSESAAPRSSPPRGTPRVGGDSHPDTAAVAGAARATSPRRRVVRPVVAIGLAAATLAALGGWIALRTPHVPGVAAAGHRDWVVVSDVADSGGDPRFDRAVSLALTTGLDQSPRVAVMPGSRIDETLVRMRRVPGTVVFDEATAREVARRDGARLVVVPAVARADSGYVLTARIIDPVTDSTLAAELTRATNSAGVLDALDNLSRGLRRDFGESVWSLATESVPLPEATTGSLSALENYAAGERAFGLRHEVEAEELWKAALQQDSDFAMAHADLGGLYYWYENRRPQGDAEFARALALLDRLPEGERMLIRARIAGWRGDRLGAVRIYREYLLQYPDDREALFQLGYNAMRGHEYADARDAFTRLAGVDSASYGVWVNIATVDRALGDFRAALAAYHRAFAVYPEAATTGNMNNEFGATYVGLGMLDSAEHVFRTMLPFGGVQQRDGYQSLAFLAMWRGRYAVALSDIDSALVVDRALNDESGAARRVLFAAQLDYALGARRAARTAMASFDSLFRRTYLEPALVMWAGRLAARDGDAARAAVMMDSLERRAHPDSPEDRASLSMMHGEMAVLGGRIQEARERFAVAAELDPTEYFREAQAHGAFSDSDFVAASRLYGDLARDRACCYEGSEFVRVAPYWVGRSEEAQQHRDAAAQAYRTFLDNWPDADTALVLLRDAKRRLVALAK